MNLFFRSVLVPFLLLAPTLGFSQRLKKSDRRTMSQIESHLRFLAGPSMSDKSPGSEGERMASEYIGKQFAGMGMNPGGETGSWELSYDLVEGRVLVEGSQLTINGNKMVPYQDFSPLPFSGQDTLETVVTPALAERGVPWFRDINEIMGDEFSGSTDTLALIRSKAEQAADRGATALFIFCSWDNQYRFDPRLMPRQLLIPVLLINRNSFSRLVPDESASLDLSLSIATEDRKKTGRSVLAFWKADADSVRVATARLAHDNEVAALIEVARQMVNDRTAHNLLFIISGQDAPATNKLSGNPGKGEQEKSLHYVLRMDTLKAEDEKLKGLFLVRQGVEVLRRHQ